MFEFLKSKKEKMLEQDLKAEKEKALREYSQLLNEILNLQIEIDILHADLDIFKRKFVNQNEKILSLIVQNSQISNLISEKNKLLENKTFNQNKELELKTKKIYEYILKKRKTSNSEEERMFFDEILEFLGRLHG